MGAILNHENDSASQSSGLSETLSNFWTNSCIQKQYSLLFDNQTKSTFKVDVKFPNRKNEPYSFKLNDQDFTVRVTPYSDGVYQCDINGHRIKFSYFKDTETNYFSCFINDKIYQFKIEEAKYLKEQSSKGSQLSTNDAVAPMPGLVDKINVKIGDQVKKGDALIVMIAMKMEYVIKASKDGIVKSVNCSTGQNVKKSAKLVSLE